MKKYNILRNKNNEIIGYREIPFNELEETVELTDEEFKQKIKELFKRGEPNGN